MVLSCLESIQNDPVAPWEGLKWPSGASGAFEKARGHLKSVRNALGAPWEHLKWPKGASGAYETVLVHFSSVQNARGRLRSI